MRLALILLLVAAALGAAPDWFIDRVLPTPRAAVWTTPAPALAAMKAADHSNVVESTELAGPSALLFHVASPPADIAAAERARREPSFALAGIIGRGDRRTAMLKDKTTNATILASVGAKVGGWKLVKLDAGCANVQRGKLSARLCL